MLIISNHENHISFNHVDTSAGIDHVPAYVYRIGVTLEPPSHILLKDRKRYDVPEKIFGQCEEFKQAIIDDFNETEGTLGAILCGVKGTGKTMVAELLGNYFVDQGMPVISVDSSWSAETIKRLAMMSAPCMVMFDEFGKVYDKDERKKLLTLFSDTQMKKVLFVVTANTSEELDEYMIRRPGRFKFFIQFKAATEETVHELADHMGIIDSHRALLVDYVKTYSITFDVLRFAMKEAKKTRDVVKWRKKMDILNVDDLPYVTLALKEVIIDGEKKYGHTSFKMADGELTFELMDDTYDVTHREIFDWNDVAKKQLPIDNVTKYRVQVAENIILIVERQVGKNGKELARSDVQTAAPKPEKVEGEDVVIPKIELPLSQD